jgi:hypothetical protein
VTDTLIEELKTALKEAINECSAHNAEYHQVTPKFKLDRWRALLSKEPACSEISVVAEESESLLDSLMFRTLKDSPENNAIIKAAADLLSVYHKSLGSTGLIVAHERTKAIEAMQGAIVPFLKRESGVVASALRDLVKYVQEQAAENNLDWGLLAKNQVLVRAVKALNNIEDGSANAI